MGRAPIQYAGKTQEDIPIFYAELMRDGKEFFRVDEDGIHEIWKGTLNASRFRLDQYGYMLLLQGDKLMTWNVLSASSKKNVIAQNCNSAETLPLVWKRSG